MPQVSVSTPAGALTKALAGQAQVTVRPGCVTWSIVAAAEHRAATMFTWWDGLPGIGPGGRGRIVLRTSYLAVHDGPHVIGAGGVGRLRLIVNGTEVASGHPDLPADPVEAMVRPGEIRATVDLAAGRQAEIEVCLRPDDWPQGPVAIRLGVTPAPDDDAMLSEAVEAARTADAAVVVVGQAEPGGRLPVTIPAAEADCPVLPAIPDDGRLEYREGLLVGYRGYDRAGTRPRFAFGHGLGYTTWAYESATADAPMVTPDGDLGVTVVLRNTGPRTGREVGPGLHRAAGRGPPAPGARAGRVHDGHRGPRRAGQGPAHRAGPGLRPLRRGGRGLGQALGWVLP